MPTKDPEKIKAKNARYDAKRAGRTRNFATVVYPESAPPDWRERLDEYHVAALISPLHDQDTNPSGEPKKPHYHVMVMFESPTEFDPKVKEIFEAIGGVGREKIGSTRGYARYLCHMDNPEKAQYDPAGVTALGGADFMDITQLPSDDIRMLGEIMAYIREQEVYSFAELLDLCSIHHQDWYSVMVMNRGWIVKEYLKSLAWEREQGYVRAADRPRTDPATGEVIEPVEKPVEN